MDNSTYAVMLHKLIITYFSLDELQHLVFDLCIEWDELSGDTRSAKARALITSLARNGRLADLITLTRENRAHVNWPDPPPLTQQIRNSSDSPQSPNLLSHQLPFSRNTHFSGREAWLTQLHEALCNRQNDIVNTYAIIGLGGVGKTQLALEYCYRHLADYNLIYWLSAADSANLDQSMAEMAYRLGVAQRGVVEQNIAVHAALRWLELTKSRWLLIFDNANAIQPQELHVYLPKLGNGTCLITTRNTIWEQSNHLPLDVFLPDEATQFLLTRTRLTNESDAVKLAQTLGYLPLALEHAAAYIATRNKSFASYINLFQQRRDALWKRAQSKRDYDKTITATWELAFAQTKSTTGATDLLNLCCFLASDGIPITLLTNLVDVLPEELAYCVQDELNFDDAIAALRQFSLLSFDGTSLFVHRMVQAVGRDRMGEFKRGEWGETAVNLTLHAFPPNKYMAHKWTEAKQIMPNALAAIDLAIANNLQNTKTAALCHRISYYLKAAGSNHEAKHYCEAGLKIRENLLDPMHPDIAESLNMMGRLVGILTGNHEEALSYTQKALVIRENALGADHPDTAETLNNIGFRLRMMGKYKQAQANIERALAIRKQAFGDDHPDTAFSYNNLGMLLQTIGNYHKAISQYEQALVIRKKIFGFEHPQTAMILSNLGAAWREIGDIERARPYTEQALAIREKHLGPDHPDTGQSLQRVGVLFIDEARFTEAEKHIRRALAIHKKAFGPDHPVTIRSRKFLSQIEAKSK